MSLNEITLSLIVHPLLEGFFEVGAADQVLFLVLQKFRARAFLRYEVFQTWHMLNLAVIIARELAQRGASSS